MNNSPSRQSAQQAISQNREWRWKKSEPCALCQQPFKAHRGGHIKDHRFTARASHNWPTDEHGCLILPCRKRGTQYETVPCPHCGRRHYHGLSDDGHRGQHCLPQEAADLLIGNKLYPARTGHYVLAPLATRAITATGW